MRGPTFSALLALIVSMSAGAAQDIPLAVEEPIGIARANAQVSGGICLPPAAFRKDQAFSLWADQTEVPVQVAPLVVDKNGFLRWVLLDFQLSLDAKHARQLLLKPTASTAKPAAAIQTSETDQVVSINTGPLELAISKIKPFTLFDSVRVRGHAVAAGGDVDYVDARTGTRYTAARPAKITWEYRGSLRCTLRIDGPYEGEGNCRLKYITRITAWAGKTDVRIQHILANSNDQQVYHANLKTASLSLRHAFGDAAEAKVAAGVNSKLADSSVWLHQGKINRYYGQPINDATKAGIGSEAKWSGADSGGWIALGNADHKILVCDRDFVGDPPRRLAADRDRISIEYITGRFSEGRGVPRRSEHAWLYDLSHKTADVYIDFDASGDLDSRAQAWRERLIAFAPGEWHSRCDVLGVGPFGTLDDEKATYAKWGWKFQDKQIPRSQPAPNAFVQWEDNHYESEADSAEGLLLMALRTGQRGFFDQGEAWARYHASLHAWRTDGWVYDDGAIWFPQGGPLGTKPARKPTNVKYQAWGKGSGDDQELWHLVQAKSCYCHFYGAGLVDYFLLTGERDALEAAIDLAEQKNSEMRKHHKFTPGKSTISDTRGFGRGFYVLTHILEADPSNALVADLTRLCRDVLWQCPNMDERGFVPCHLGTGFGGFDLKRDLPAEMRAFMEQQGIAIDAKGWLTDKTGKRWPVVCLGGTWQHAYVQAASERYARLTGDEDMADFTDAFGRFAARFMLSDKCRQTQYYAYMDVPIKGQAWDPWRFVPPHTTTTDGDGCVHSGWYTCFFPDAMARAYSLTGDPRLLDRAREFWHYGSKRGYQTKRMSAGTDAVGQFAHHVPPKDDTVLSTSRMFYEWSHPRADTTPPPAVQDLSVSIDANGKATVRFTAPADIGGGKVVRYQLKCADKPIVGYDDYDFARDDGQKRNFWRAANLSGEPAPAAPGFKEQFTVSSIPAGSALYLVVVSFDASGNRSGLSNVCKVGSGQ